MPEIYMISLKRDSVRRAQMQKNFSNYYDQIKIIDAIDAKDEKNLLLIENYYKPCKHDKRKPLTLGEKCCSISHILALEAFLKTGQESCIIIEDDLIGTDNDFDGAIKMTNKIKDKDIIILGGQQGLKNAIYLSGMKVNVQNLWLVANIARQFVLRTCCYSVTRQVALRILQSQKRCLTRADSWYLLLNKDISIYYADVFKHPVDLKGSNLEQERKPNSLLMRVYQDGIVNLLLRNAIKTMILLLRILHLTTTLPIKS